MKLPNANKVIITKEKIIDYVLSETQLEVKIKPGSLKSLVSKE